MNNDEDFIRFLAIVVVIALILLPVTCAVLSEYEQVQEKVDESNRELEEAERLLE